MSKNRGRHPINDREFGFLCAAIASKILPDHPFPELRADLD